MSPNELTRIAVLGEPGNGKTEGIYKHNILDKNGRAYPVEIMDTAGCMIDDLVRREGHIKWADGFVLVYSITDKHSFAAIRDIKEQIHRIKKLNICYTIVGNKTDLEHLRQVEIEQREKFAADIGCSIYELSACTEENSIADPFLDVCKDVEERQSQGGKKVHRQSSAGKMLRKLIRKKLSI